MADAWVPRRIVQGQRPATAGPHDRRQKHRNAACVKSGGCSAVSSCSA